MQFAPKDEDRKAVKDALMNVGIPHLANRPYTDLSGGEQQLVVIARTLAQIPR